MSLGQQLSFPSFLRVRVNPADQDTYEFGPFRLDVPKRVLLREGERVALAPKALDMLIVLVRHQGQVLEKDRLMELLWPDTVVEEANLPLNVSALRKALRESPGERKYIVTVPGRGYKFAAEIRQSVGDTTTLIIDRYSKATMVVEERDDDEENVAQTPFAGSDEKSVTVLPQTVETQEPLRRTPLRQALLITIGGAVLVGAIAFGWSALQSRLGPDQTAIRSLAVLPFKSLSAGGDESFPLGMTDVLITRLSNLREVTVRPTSAVLKYAHGEESAIEIGRDLGVESVLEGSIHRSEGVLRVTLRLLRVSDGATLWADKIDARSTDIFVVEDMISEQVAEKLTLQLNRETREALARHETENQLAHLLFLKGRYEVERRTPDGARQAIDFFREAIEADSRYALAHVGMAESYGTLALSGAMVPNEAFPRLKEAATKALAISPLLADGYTLLGVSKFFHEWDYSGAERDLRKAIEINPNHARAHEMLGHLSSNLGKHGEGVVEFDRAIALNPMAMITHALRSQALTFAGRYDDAITRMKELIELEPGFWISHLVLGKVYERKAMYRQALTELQTAWEQSGYGAEAKSYLGYTYAASGARKEAERALDELKRVAVQRYVSPKSVALVSAGLGDEDEMFTWLEKAYEGRDIGLAFLKVEPRWNPYRADRRFADLMRRVGFTE